ncbi:MAG: guanylate kinase [Hyphomicrobiaceae bacterium]
MATVPAKPESTAPRRGLMLVLSSPSGAGKTTLSREILKREPALAMSVSVTTRKPRAGEVDGRDYHFRTPDQFQSLRDAGGLLEWAEVHGNFYGTPAADVMKRLERGDDVLFDVDWQGARQLAAKAPADTVRVFILPPSAGALEQRLVARQQDGRDVIERRLAGAAVEIERWAEYDYVIVNESIEESLARLVSILAAERSRVPRQTLVPSLVDQILADLALRGRQPR